MLCLCHPGGVEEQSCPAHVGLGGRFRRWAVHGVQVTHRPVLKCERTGRVRSSCAIGGITVDHPQWVSVDEVVDAVRGPVHLDLIVTPGIQRAVLAIRSGEIRIVDAEVGVRELSVHQRAHPRMFGPIPILQIGRNPRGAVVLEHHRE